LTIVNPFLTKTIVDDVINGGNKQILISLLLTIIGVTIFRQIVRFICLMNFEKISQKVVLDIRMKGYNKLMELDFGYFDEHKSGDIMAQLTADVDMIRHFIAYVIYQTFENSVIFLGALFVLVFYINAYLSVGLFLVIPIVAFLAFKLAIEQKSKFRRLRETRSILNTVVSENIWAQRAVKAFVREDYENSKLNTVNERFRENQFDINKISRKYIPYLNNINGIIQVYLVIFGGVFTINGYITIGDLIMFNSMIWLITLPLSRSGFLTNDFINCFSSYEKIMELLNQTPVILDKNKTRRLEKIEGKIEFKNVRFGYEDNKALKDVSFLIKKGTKVGIIGQTGSGKSTIINLLSRFYDPDSGAIFIDDHYLKDIDLDLLRSSIATSQQDVFLFSDTVAKNIAYGSPNASLKEIENAAKMANAEEFIKKLPEGYNTVVGERGVGLSGGQKQRLALARAILKKPSILILDDTTSALDSETEREIQEYLKEICENKTLIIISQKISSVKDCDMILVLKDGQIIERGSHDALLDNKGYYYNIFKHQFGGVNCV
jgi:ATP-binding cassette subfamily B protein